MLAEVARSLGVGPAPCMDIRRSESSLATPGCVMLHFTADACPSSHANDIYAAAASKDKDIKLIEGAGHYYKGQPDKLNEAIAVLSGWLSRQGLSV